MKVIYVGADNVLELQDFQNQVTSEYINDATVSVTLKDSASTNVTGESWPLTMVYVAASNGKYRATLTDSLSLIEDEVYTAVVSADGGDGLAASFNCQMIGATRRCT